MAHGRSNHLTPFKGKALLVLFLFLCAMTVSAQRPVVKKKTTTTVHRTTTPQKKKTTTAQSKKSTTTQGKKPTATVETYTRPLTVPTHQIVVVNTQRQDSIAKAEADTSQVMLDDSLKITHIEMPVASIPTKLDSMLKAHLNNKFVRRIDSVLSTSKAQQKIMGGIRKMVRIDSILTERYKKYKTDRNYVIRPPERITFKVTLSSLGTSMNTNGRTASGIKAKTRLTADFKNSMNFSATYRGITIGGSLDPTRFFKKNKDVEFNIVSYGNRYGFDAVYQRANSFTGHATIDGHRYDIHGGNVRQRMIAGNAYYVFNYKKFSYSAAFSQSFIQRRSAGSFLLGMSFLNRKTKSNYNIEGLTTEEMQERGEEPQLTTTQEMVLRGANLGIGAGYGYNWVPHRRWLVHLSLLPTLMIINTNKQQIGDEENKIPHKFPQTIITGRSAIIYSFRNMFIGGTAVMTRSSFGETSNLKISTQRWQLQLFWGARLWK